jgi:hypothetical protein
MRGGGIGLVLEFDGEACFGKAADDESLVESTFELVPVAKPFEEPLGQFGVVGREVEIVGQTKIGLDRPGHGPGVDLTLVAGCVPPLEVAELVIPAQKGMTLVLGFF